MTEMVLTPKERQALKARAHALRPVVLLGASGLSVPVLQEIDRALAAHGLIKVKVPGDDRAERERMFATVAERLSAARVQAIGKLLVFYRPVDDEAAGASAREVPPMKPKGPKDERSKKAPLRPPITAGARMSGNSRPERRDVERVQRGAAPRRDPGAAYRAVGRTNAPKGRRGR